MVCVGEHLGRLDPQRDQGVMSKKRRYSSSSPAMRQYESR
jgi:hypothetical protein